VISLQWSRLIDRVQSRETVVFAVDHTTIVYLFALLYASSYCCCWDCYIARYRHHRSLRTMTLLSILLVFQFMCFTPYLIISPLNTTISSSPILLSSLADLRQALASGKPKKSHLHQNFPASSPVSSSASFPLSHPTSGSKRSAHRGLAKDTTPKRFELLLPKEIDF
jgi:hypothetical protein